MRIVFVTPTPPAPRRTRAFGFLAQLAPRHEVTSLCLCRTPQDLTDASRLRALGVRVVPIFEERRAALGRQALAAALGDLPVAVAAATAPKLLLALMEELRRGVDVVHAEGIEVAAAVRGLAAPVVWDANICASRLAYLREVYSPSLFGHTLHGAEARRLRQYEYALLRTFEHVAVSSERDRLALLGPNRTRDEEAAQVIPTGIDLDMFSPLRGRRHRQRLVFSGPLHTAAGAAGAEWLLGEVMPRIWCVRPDVRVTLVGPHRIRRMSAFARDPRVSVAAHVEDPRRYLAGAAVALSPLPYAAGTPTEALEAMAMGTPLVAMEAATSGLRTIPGRDLLVADRPERYARLVLRLLEEADLQRMLGRNGRMYIERHHSWARAATQLEALYERAVGTASTASAHGESNAMSDTGEPMDLSELAHLAPVHPQTVAARVRREAPPPTPSPLPDFMTVLSRQRGAKQGRRA